MLRIARNVANALALTLLVAVSLPLLSLRSLLTRRNSVPAPQPPTPHQFDFAGAIPAYEALIDSTANTNP